MCLNKQENLNNDGGDECPRGMAPLLASGGRGGGRNSKIQSCRQPLNNCEVFFLKVFLKFF